MSNQPDFYTMFLKLFEVILAALRKDVKLTLLTILIVLLLSWGIYGEARVKNMDKQCDHRLAAKEDELKQIRERMFDLFIEQQLQKNQTQENESQLRQDTDKDVKHVLQ